MVDTNKYIKEIIALIQRKVSQIGHRIINKGRSIVLSQPLNEFQNARLYSEIKFSNYFDESWYRLAYKDQIEYPDDLLLDYIKAGIPNGRDPSPYFNTILYLREQDVPPEQALVHFLRSGRATASGAYRNEQALLAAQQSFRAQTGTDLIADRRSSDKLFAVYLQCGEDSVWRDWQPSQDQPWHLLINHYDSTYKGKIPCDVEFRQTGALPGTKFTSFRDILVTYTHIFDPYQYILLLDDDVYFQNGDISCLFSTVQQYEWEMAAASLSDESFCSFPVYINHNRTGFRQVNGVEIMMPMYSTRILGIVRQLISESISGWGFDAALSMLAASQGFRAAVVDDVVAQHTRPINADIGQYYRMLHRAQIYPEIEFTHLQKKYGFSKPLFYEL